MAHFVSGLLVIWLSTEASSKQQFVSALAIFALFVLVVDLIRIHSSAVNAQILKIFRAFVREGEQERLSGMPYYWWGITFSYLVFPDPVASLAVLYLAVGDPAAALMGSFCQSRGWCWKIFEGKSWQGSFAAVVSCGVATYFVWPWILDNGNLEGTTRWQMAIVGGLAAGIGELLPLRTDDNLSLPLVSGALVWIYLSLWGVLLI
jgi:diacylglycerol kinase (CTP)